MRHRIKKIPTLSKLNHKFNHHLLHSDKSTYTYFYKGKVKVGSLGKHILYSPSIPLLGGTALLLVLGLSVGCVGGASGMGGFSGGESAYAETITPEQCNSETKLALSLNGVTGDSVNLSKNVDDDIASGSISKVSQDFNVIACMVRNYKLYVQAESSLLKNTNVPDALYGVGENVAESDFNENTWGYSVVPKGNTSTIYNTVPELAETIPEAYTGNTSTSNTGQDFTITFAAKFGNNKPAGHYTSNVLLSMVAEPEIVLTSLTYMQEMTSEVCARSAVNSTKRLKDGRDDKYYWVTKLADGNCWMTQNLDLDLWNSNLNQPVTLYSSNDGEYKNKGSDLSEDWTSTTGSSQVWSTDDATIVKFYDPGYYTLTNGVTKNDTANSDWLISPSLSDQAGIDAHYTQGNYYSFGAATTGKGTELSIINTDVGRVSICPTGWQLPLSGYNETTNVPFNKNKSYANLFESYGWSWDIETANNPNRSTPTMVKDDIEYSVTNAPFYFVRAGYVSSYYGRLDRFGDYGYYYSGTKWRKDIDFALAFSNDILSPANSGTTYFGYSIRCVAR